MDREPIIKDNYIPMPPTGDGWRDKVRDHDFFQINVSLRAQLVGASATAGCSTPGAEQARQAAEQRFYRGNEIHVERILKEI